MFENDKMYQKWQDIINRMQIKHSLFFPVISFSKNFAAV